MARCVYAYILLHILRVVNKYFEFHAYFEYFCVVEQLTNMNFVRFAMNTMDLILKLLKENNKEQKELCDFIGISQQNFTDWAIRR